MEPDLWLFENNAALDIIDFLDRNEPENCIKELVENNNIAALTIYPITDELAMIHHWEDRISPWFCQ